MTKPFKHQSNPLRVGAVSYLNSKPLVYGLEESFSGAELVYELPSRLSDALASEELAVALVPSIELASHPQWTIISDACISCRGPVLSVKLVFRVPPLEVRTLALDEGSRTSSVMAQILLTELYGVFPQLSTLPIGREIDQSDADAVLVIGDRAIRTDQRAYQEVWDLGDRWCRWAKVPFVFAMWGARPGIDSQSLDVRLATARDTGCRHLLEIAHQQAAAMNLPLELVEEYLCENLYFRLGPQQLRGLEFFYERAAAQGFIETAPKVILDDCPVER